MDEQVIYAEFSPDQKRDPDGKFAAGKGGGAMGRHPMATTAAGAAVGYMVGNLPGAAIGSLAGALMSRHSAKKATEAAKEPTEPTPHETASEGSGKTEAANDEPKVGKIRKLAQEHPKTAIAVGVYVGSKVGGALPGAAYDAATSATGVSGKTEHFGDAGARALVTAPFRLAGAAAGAYAGHKMSQPSGNHELTSKAASMISRAK